MCTTGCMPASDLHQKMIVGHSITTGTCVPCILVSLDVSYMERFYGKMGLLDLCI